MTFQFSQLTKHDTSKFFALESLRASSRELIPPPEVCEQFTPNLAKRNGKEEFPRSHQTLNGLKM